MRPELCESRSGDVLILRLLIPLAPGNNDVIAACHITCQFDRKPAFKVLFTAAITTWLAGVSIGAGARPADQDVHTIKYNINP
jgi:hypothetical protein